MKKIYMLFIVVVVVLSMFITNTTYAATYTNGIDNSFPEEYKVYLRALKIKYPNWTFTAKNTGLNWSDAVTAQTAEAKSLTDQTDSWWRRDNIEVESGWVNASRAAIEYAMNPLNFLTEEQIFQFETLEYNSNIETKAGVDAMLYSTKMSLPVGNGTYVTLPIRYYDKDGYIKEDLNNKTYSQVIYDAGKNNGVNPYHLAARIKNETGADIDSNLSINGRYHPVYNPNCIGDYRGLYNYYNIGANGAHPIANGLIYASTPGIYGEPWDNPEKAIIGGALFTKNEYINKGQNTLYYQKYNVASTTNNFYTHQYMTNILAARTEASLMFKVYKESSNNILNMAHEFIIPVYNNSPGVTPIENFVADNTRVYLDAVGDNDPSDTFTIRSAPSSSSTALKTITLTNEQKQSKTCPYVITRIGIGQGNYDQVKIQDLSGNLVVSGYIFKPYVYVLNYPKITNITLNKSTLLLNYNTFDILTTTIQPSNAWYTNIVWTSNNSSIATVSSEGRVIGVGAGTTQIIGRSAETGVTATCTVTVIPPSVSSITLSKTDYTVLNGKTLEIIPTVLPTIAVNKKYITTVEKPTIAEITADGKILAKAVGTTKVTFTTEDQNKTVIANVTVVDASSVTFNVDSSISVTGNEMSKINPGTTTLQLKNKITTNAKLEIKNIKNEVLKDSDNVGTGTRIIVKSLDDTVLFEDTIIIYGDISGDGLIDVTDLLMLKRTLTNKLQLGTAAKKAATISKIGSTPDVTDLLRLKRHLTNKTLIVQ